MPLGVEVGIGPSHIVLDGNPAPRAKRLTASNAFAVCLRFYKPQSMSIVHGQTATWIRMPLGTEVALGPGDIMLDGNPAPPRKGAQQPPTFRPVSIVEKRSPISATGELLLLQYTDKFDRLTDIEKESFRLARKAFTDSQCQNDAVSKFLSEDSSDRTPAVSVSLKHVLGTQSVHVDVATPR